MLKEYNLIKYSICTTIILENIVKYLNVNKKTGFLLNVNIVIICIVLIIQQYKVINVKIMKNNLKKFIHVHYVIKYYK
jgi:hypothetical protein